MAYLYPFEGECNDPSLLGNKGANLVTISPGSQSTNGVQGGFGSSQTLTLDDATALSAAKFASISQVSPEVSRRKKGAAFPGGTILILLNTLPIGGASHIPSSLA